MIRGLYTAAAGMVAQQKRNELLTNNLVNSETPGYKSSNPELRTFPEQLIYRIRDQRLIPNETAGVAPLVGSLPTGIFLEEGVPIFTQGDLIETGNKNDLAIWDSELPIDPTTQQKPALFFAVKDRNGERLYTRNGHFTLDALGYLTTQDGDLVLDENGNPIQLNYGEEYQVTTTGNILLNDGTSIPLGVWQINDPYQIEKRGLSNYQYTGNPNNLVRPADNFAIYQGKLERSNVDITRTMTDLTSALRLYEANQKVIQTLDKTLDKAVNEIGRV